MPAQPEPTDRAEIQKLANAVEEALAGEMRTSFHSDNPTIPSFEDGTRIGDTPPVPQPDSRIVPALALGIAVASIGVGAGVTGIGCGVWLACQGFAAVTLNSVLMVTLPFAGLAMVVTAIGGAINKARDVNTTHNHHYNGPVRQKNQTTNSCSIWAKNINEQ